MSSRGETDPVVPISVLPAPAPVERDLSGPADLVRQRGAAEGDAVALTFDDGPVTRTAHALDILDAHDAKGTFFLVGEKVRGHEPLLERMLTAGHEIGNHSFHHPRYPSVEDIISASAQLRQLIGVAPRVYRPPYGAIDRPTAIAVREAGMTPVTWDVDSEDVLPMWKGLAPEGVYRNIVDRARPGSIVLLHDGSVWSRAVEALPRIISTLRERGFRLVTVSKLLAEGDVPSGVAGAGRERPTSGRADRVAGGPRPARRWLRRRSETSLATRGWPEELEALKPRAVLASLERRGRSGPEGERAEEQLGRALAVRVAANPVAFSRLADRVLALDRLRLRSVLKGLAAAAQRTGDLDWDGVLALVEATLSGPPSDPSRREAALLLTTALGADTVPREMRGRVWPVLDRLSWTGRDAANEEAGEDADHTRVQAMSAVLRYARWACSGDFASLPEVRDNLEAHLDPTRETSEAVRGFFGAHLAELSALDRDWLAAHMHAIFPSDPTLANLRDAAWEGHLVWGITGGELFVAPEAWYRRAVHTLPAPAESRRGDHSDPGRIIARHLGELLRRGAIEVEEGGLVQAFVGRSAPDELAYLVKLMGLRAAPDQHSLDEPFRRRLTGLWEAIVQEAAGRAPSDAAEILAPFGTWYAAGSLDPSWLDERLSSVLVRGIVPEPVFRVIGQLARRAQTDPGTAIRLASAYIELAGGWDLRATGESLNAIARAALGASDPEVREAGRRLVRTLGVSSRASRPGDEPQFAPTP